MIDDSDAQLRDKFSRLRLSDESGGPDFAALVSPDALTQARRRQRGRKLGTAATLAGLSGLVLFILGSPDTDNRAPARSAATIRIDLGAVYWRAPSDFLLDTPGRDLLRGLPTFTTSPVGTVGPPTARPRPESTSAARGRSNS